MSETFFSDNKAENENYTAIPDSSRGPSLLVPVYDNIDDSMPLCYLDPPTPNSGFIFLLEQGEEGGENPPSDILPLIYSISRDCTIGHDLDSRLSGPQTVYHGHRVPPPEFLWNLKDEF